ncbi:MAG: T9SS type A sorting domain-containing protein [Bacteroidota bacterium]
MGKKIRLSMLLLFFIVNVVQLNGQIALPDPPVNAFLADSPWPIYHRNNYAQSSTNFKGPLVGDSLRTVYKGDISGGTSPWVYLSEYYSNGERALLYSNATFVFKLVDTGEKIITADSLRIDFDFFQSFGWNFLLAKNKIWFTYDPKYDPTDNKTTRLFKLTDADTSDVYSEIIVLDTFDFGDYGINRVQHYSLNYDGQIVFNSDNNTEEGYGTVGVVTQDFELLDTLRFSTTADEITNHNAFPIDENNSFYITTTKRLLKFDWDGQELSIDWEAPYNFVGDGPVGTFAEGSGTTPTLLGWGEGNDQLVVMSDGHAKNNLLAFWRTLPDDWQGIPGMDIHFADSIQLPAAATFSDQFQSIENSPTAYGYDIAIAQFNGFLGYDCENFKGVQKVRWDTTANQFSIDWVNDQINMNGVLTYSQGANTVYCSGKEADCNYYYYGLDWETGAINFRYLLGPEGNFFNDPFYDPGSNNVIDEHGNIYFPGAGSLVKVEILERSTSTLDPTLAAAIALFPNPTDGHLEISTDLAILELSLHDIQGQTLLRSAPFSLNHIVLSDLANGIYFLRLVTESGTFVKKVLKH